MRAPPRGAGHLHGRTWQPPLGFDHFAIMRGLGEYRDPELFTNTFAPFQGAAHAGHSSDVLARAATRWLRNHTRHRGGWRGGGGGGAPRFAPPFALNAPLPCVAPNAPFPCPTPIAAAFSGPPNNQT